MKIKKIRCKNCGNYFYPDNFNRHTQRYCSRSECRKASNAASSRAYRKKKSRDHEFRNLESERVKKWQRKNPNYWKKKSSKKIEKNKVLRDIAQVEKVHSEMTVLRDITNLQCVVMEGLIVTLTGTVLRDDIGAFIRRMYDKGKSVSGREPENSFIMQLLNERTNNDRQKINRFSSQTPNTDTFQLGRS